MGNVRSANVLIYNQRELSSILKIFTCYFALSEMFTWLSLISCPTSDVRLISIYMYDVSFMITWGICILKFQDHVYIKIMAQMANSLSIRIMFVLLKRSLGSNFHSASNSWFLDSGIRNSFRSRNSGMKIVMTRTEKDIIVCRFCEFVNL